MNLLQLKDTFGDYAKDIKLNLSTMLDEAGAKDLNQKQIMSVALTSAYTTKNKDVIAAAHEQASGVLSAEELNACKAAAVLMAMNNIYYRFTHAVSDEAYSTLPVGLRMNVMMNPGTDKTTFELCSIAASAITGCGLCMDAHTKQLEKHGVSKQAIQSAVKIASVVHAAAMAQLIA